MQLRHAGKEEDLALHADDPNRKLGPNLSPPPPPRGLSLVCSPSFWYHEYVHLLDLYFFGKLHLLDLLVLTDTRKSSKPRASSKLQQKKKRWA